MLKVQTLGGLAVFDDGRDVRLPPSRKTRALLAYLAVTGRRQRRERLCELFWDVPDDPRGSLRWSLSKIRRIFGNALEADHETVGLRSDAFVLDFRYVQRAESADIERTDVDELERIAAVFQGTFLEDLALPRCPEFDGWRTASAGKAELAHLRVRRALVNKLAASDPERALLHARTLQSLHPADPRLAIEIETLLDKSRRRVLAQTRPPRRETSGIANPYPPQDIRYCRSGDGVQLAYAIAGEGYPILKCANWMSHLEYEWESPIWRHWMHGLSRNNRLVRYDQRGNGLSDWDTPDVSFESMLADLECVADAAGLDRFALLGVSRGCAISVAYAARHRERVSHLVLYGGRSKGWRSQGDPAEIARRAAMVTLIRTGWGQDNPAFRRLFTSLFIPGATAAQTEWFNELQRRTISPENAARYQETAAGIDVSALLAQVAAPTLVLHATGDAVVPFEGGRSLAIGIPGARFVPLDSKNHILLDGEPAFSRFLEEIARFLKS